MLFLIYFLFPSAVAQITDASFFPSVKSINPGVSHLRQFGFVAVDASKKNIEKKHDVTMGGIVGGINTDVDLDKRTFFAAGRGRTINGEVLFDQESGTRSENINSPSNGNRTVKNKASSSYIGGLVDFKYFGVSYSGANYDYTNKFRVGSVPSISAHDEKQDLTYKTFKIGTALKIKGIRIGGYFLDQKGDGDYTYTFYDPSTGNQGTTEKFAVSSTAKGYGAGIGFTLPRFRSEISLEKMYDTELKIPTDYPREIKQPESSSRMTLVGEVKVYFISLGIRYRSIKGNYADMEDIISSSLLYDKMGPDDVRTETSFNFSLGNTKGFSPSAFYTQSEVSANEIEPIFESGEKFKSRTKSKAYGVNLSYLF